MRPIATKQPVNATGRLARFASVSVCLAFLVAMCGQVEATPEPSAAGASGLSVCLRDASRWRICRFGQRPVHGLRFSSGGLEMAVNRSSMPLYYPLKQAKRVCGIRVKGRVVGVPAVSPLEQGADGHDDFSLRVGLIEPGDRRLSGWERLRAPEWVRTLFDLAPPGRGIARVRFLDLGVAGSTIPRSLDHSMEGLVVQDVVAVPRSDGTFDIDHALNPPVEVCAVCILADGDDTGSVFTSVVTELTLETGP